jgi:hypothetical protein
MRPIDRAVLVCHATIIARRRHAVMRAQRLVALGQIRRRVPIEIAERRREAVAAVFRLRATQNPQGVLQSLRQGDEALAAQYHVGLLPARERQAEVIHTELAGIGEIRQNLLTRRMRRSSVRHKWSAKSACRRCISSSSLIGRNPGDARSIGTISLSQYRQWVGTPPSTRRPPL